MSLEIKSNLNNNEADEWAAFQALSDDEKGERLWRENQERSHNTWAAQQAESEGSRDLMLSYNSRGQLEAGNVTPDSIIMLERSGISARAADLVTAGVIPASAIGMPYDTFLETMDEY